MMLRILLLMTCLGWLGCVATAESLPTQNSQQLQWKKIESSITSGASKYQKVDGTVAMIHDDFFVELNEGVNILDFIKTHSLSLVKQYADATFLLKTTNPDVIAEINKLRADVDTKNVYPNTIRNIQTR